MTTANAIIAAAKDELLAYRAVVGTGSYTSLPGFVLDRDELAPPNFSESGGAEDFPRTGRVTGPLTPALGYGYGIRDGNNEEWAVVRVDFDQMQILTVERVTVRRGGVDRGHAG
jgi:hypothetical protein